MYVGESRVLAAGGNHLWLINYTTNSIDLRLRIPGGRITMLCHSSSGGVMVLTEDETYWISKDFGEPTKILDIGSLHSAVAPDGTLYLTQGSELWAVDTAR